MYICIHIFFGRGVANSEPCFQSVYNFIEASQEETWIRVLREHKFFYPMDLTFEEQSPLEGFPWLRPSKFLQVMSRMNDLSHILGGRRTILEAERALVEFWTRYRRLYPDHQLWDEVDTGRKDIRKCIPLLIHGDEGTTYKKGGVLVVSFQGILGYGCRKRCAEEDRQGTIGEGIRLNFLRTGLQTRVLILVCPKDCMALYT
jgi:hypothetical protein